MSDSQRAEGTLAAVFDELIDLVHETQQAVWATSSPQRRQAFEALQQYLAEQAAAVDDAEQRAGGRPDWESEPSAHRVRNILGQASDDPDRVVEILLEDLTRAVGDIRARSKAVDGQWGSLLSDVANGLEHQIGQLRAP